MPGFVPAQNSNEGGGDEVPLLHGRPTRTRVTAPEEGERWVDGKKRDVENGGVKAYSDL